MTVDLSWTKERKGRMSQDGRGESARKGGKER